MRLVSYNARGLRRGADVARVLRALDADVVGLQEPGRGPLGRLRLRRACRRTGLRVVARAGSTALLVGRDVTVTEVGAVRLPRDARSLRRPLPTGRGASTARVDGVRVVVLHLGLSAAGRAAQLDRLGARCSGQDPVVVLADLNEAPGRPSWRALAGPLRDAAAEAGPTFPALGPTGRIDAVLTSPDLAVTAAQVPDRPPVAVASDHRPVVVDLLTTRR